MEKKQKFKKTKKVVSTARGIRGRGGYKIVTISKLGLSVSTCNSSP